MGPDGVKLQESMDWFKEEWTGSLCLHSVPSNEGCSCRCFLDMILRKRQESNRQHCRFHAGKPRRGDIRVQTLGILSNTQTWTSIEFKTVIMSNKNKYSSS